MAQHGSAQINSRSPRALAVCDRCGRLTNHDRLTWQTQWVGAKLQNIRLLVCDQGCLDKPQEQLRTIILPPDPMPIENARPENYVDADNPLSALGATPNTRYPTYSNQIGTLTGGGGIAAAFDGSVNKPAWMCASNTISRSSYENYVGINWTGANGMVTTPSSLSNPTVKHSLTSFTAYAPSDRSFLGHAATSYVVQSSPIYPVAYSGWTTVSSGTTVGTNGETITGTCNGSEAQYHRIAFLGDQINFVSIAGLEFNVGQIESAST